MRTIVEYNLFVRCDGEAEIMISGKKQAVTSGNFVILPANEPHSLQAVKKFKMLLVMIREKKKEA